MIEIALHNIEKYYGANHILKGVTFDVEKGEKVGLLGKNGAGKTTLFKIIGGLEPGDGGDRMVRKGAVAGILDQISVFPVGYTTYDVLRSAYEDLQAVHQQMTDMEKQLAANCSQDSILERYGNLQQLFEARGGYMIDDNIARIACGLNFAQGLLQTEFSLLSGGEKTRVMLGRLLLQKPDILLLDEPTNHLDVRAIEWLESFLGEYDGTVVVISHDRYFLDKVVTRIVEINDGKADLYAGNYSFYVAEKEARYERQLDQYEQEQKKIRQLTAAAKRLHEWGQRADNPAMHKQAFNIEKRIERMKKTERPQQEKELNTMFAEQDFSGKEIIVAAGLVKTYAGKAVLDNVDFTVQRGERVALLGDNGSGKSTLLKIITGEVEADAGNAKLGNSIRYAYLPQVISFENPDLSVLDTVRYTLGGSEGEARKLLAKYRFKNEDVYRKAVNLSGGEKSRLWLCLLMQRDVNLLLLDEPTNHLDIASREWLEAALVEYSCTVLFITHDRYFVDKFATRILELRNGKIYGHYDNYEHFRQQRLAAQADAAKSKLPETKQPRTGKAKREPAAGKTAAQDLKIEENILALETMLTDLDNQMLLCGNDFTELELLFQQKTEIGNKLEELYQQWVQA